MVRGTCQYQITTESLAVCGRMHPAFSAPPMYLFFKTPPSWTAKVLAGDDVVEEQLHLPTTPLHKVLYTHTHLPT